ncbi:MAG: hypothetical protein CM15mP130_0300 [Verrucomicrobiota bacterium]|nr:MAG: hypothetical protein CM15mP130_0300 [Verrucomicrobiota bacterium]
MSDQWVHLPEVADELVIIVVASPNPLITRRLFFT